MTIISLLKNVTLQLLNKGIVKPIEENQSQVSAPTSADNVSQSSIETSKTYVNLTYFFQLCLSLSLLRVTIFRKGYNCHAFKQTHWFVSLFIM